MLLNYYTRRPQLSSSSAGAYGSQYFRNFLGQLLVKDLEVASLENCNEAAILRSILKLAANGVIIFSAVVAVQAPCTGCAVPYSAVGWGLIGSFVARSALMLYVGFYDYHLYNDAAREVRTYQESLVRLQQQQRLPLLLLR
jgi:hypothetical protein